VGYDPLTLYVVFVIFVATLIRSTLGFGEALVAVPLLALRIPVVLAAPLAVLVSIVVAGAVVLQDWRRIDVRSVVGLVAATLVGIPLGLLLLTRVNDRAVKLGLGAIIVGFAGYSLTARRDQPPAGEDARWLIACGFVAGVLGGAYGMNGPPLVVYGARHGWSPQRFRATLQGYFLPASLAGMIGYARMGLWRASVTTYFVWSLPGIAAAVVIGRAINERVPADAFRRLVHAGLIVTGAALAVQAMR
jgi:uncharacterized membrane protein YfcA